MREDICFFPLYTPDESLASKKYYIIGIILFQIHLVVYVGSAYFIVWFYSPPALQYIPTMKRLHVYVPLLREGHSAAN